MGNHMMFWGDGKPTLAILQADSCTNTVVPQKAKDEPPNPGALGATQPIP